MFSWKKFAKYTTVCALSNFIPGGFVASGIYILISEYCDRYRKFDPNDKQFKQFLSELSLPQSFKDEHNIK
jgi:hypothetical protein